MFKVIEENDEFLVVYKPAGLSFHSENGPGFFNLLQEQLNYKIYSVHRLDKETSGLLIVAKSSESASLLVNLFKEHKISKTYIALSDKKPSKKQGMVKGDLIKGRSSQWKLSKTLNSASITKFHSYGFEDLNLRLFVLIPHTGKTHQLRVVMKSLSSPIIGDKLYKGIDADRMYLHCFKLEIPWKNKTIQIKSIPIEGEFFHLSQVQNLITQLFN